MIAFQPTPAQQLTIDRWEQENNPDGKTFDYADNHRWATKGDAEQEAEYWRIEKIGCCGSCDVELQCDDGTVLLYGFNYGH